VIEDVLVETAVVFFWVLPVYSVANGRLLSLPNCTLCECLHTYVSDQFFSSFLNPCVRSGKAIPVSASWLNKKSMNST